MSCSESGQKYSVSCNEGPSGPPQTQTLPAMLLYQSTASWCMILQLLAENRHSSQNNKVLSYDDSLITYCLDSLASFPTNRTGLAMCFSKQCLSLTSAWTRPGLYDHMCQDWPLQLHGFPWLLSAPTWLCPPPPRPLHLFHSSCYWP